MPPAHVHFALGIRNEVTILQSIIIALTIVTLLIDERMYPQRDSELLLLQIGQKLLYIRELLGIECSRSIASLPVIVDLDLAVVEPILQDLIGELPNGLVVDFDLVSSPSGPDRMRHHDLIRMSRGFIKVPLDNTLVSQSWIRINTDLVVQRDAGPLAVRILVLRYQTQVLIFVVILVEEQRVSFVHVDVNSSVGQPVPLGQSHVLWMCGNIGLLFVVHVLDGPVLVSKLRSAKPLRVLLELVTVDYLALRIGYHALDSDDLAVAIGFDLGMGDVASHYASSQLLAILLDLERGRVLGVFDVEDVLEICSICRVKSNTFNFTRYRNSGKL